MARRKIKAFGSNVLKSGNSELAYYKKLQKVQNTDAIYPLDAPGLPPLPPNSAFVAHANALGDTEAAVVEVMVPDENGKSKKVRKVTSSELLASFVQDALRKPGFQMPVSIGPHRKKVADFVPGHLWAKDVTGPRPAEVMIINKMPWQREINQQRQFAGKEGELLLDLLNRLKAKSVGNWYVTSLCKFQPPDWKKNLKAVWIKDCMHLLYHEIKIVQPKFILCLGSDVSKAMLGSQASVTAMEGRVEELTYTTAFTEGTADKHLHTAKIMTVTHPSAVIRDQSAGRQLEQGMGRFCSLVNGVNVGENEEVDHRVVDSYEELYATLVDIENDETKEDDVIAVDAEWHGNHPHNAGSYVRTIQLAWQPKKAIGIKIHDAGGKATEGFSYMDCQEGLDWDGPAELLTAFFNGGEYGNVKFRKKRVVGHFFNSDLEWLVALGVNIQPAFVVPLRDYEVTSKKTKRNLLYRNEGFKVGDVVPAWYRTKFEGGADTGLMAHAIEETASYKLETLAMRYTNAPRYDTALTQWRESYCKATGLNSSTMEGYGECPDDVLLPYGIYDADVTLRLFYAFDVLLDEDYEKNCCREAFWESQIATSSVLEIHQTGITVDRKRVDFLTSRFLEAKLNMEKELRDIIRWPDFNIRSTQHVKEFLFGHKLNGKLDKETGKNVRIRPEGAISLNLRPIFDTSKPPKLWTEILKVGKTDEHSPSTDKQVLSLLAREHADSPVTTAYPEELSGHNASLSSLALIATLGGFTRGGLVNKVRDYRFIDQVLKTVLRAPAVDDDTKEVMYDEHGNQEYEDGLASMCCDDGRVRTYIYQTKETGRWSSARPNLQNISKQRDPDYKRLLGDEYKYSLRSVLKAAPGHVLIEADYVGAELFGMAIMSGDENMIDHAMRNQLPEDHEDFYDIHSNVACFAFKLDCAPTKSGLAAIGKKSIRIVAKSVIFGIAYGRGAKAIAVAAKEQGIDVTVDEAQAVIDAIFQMYPRLEPFFAECRARATGTFVDPDTGPVKHNYLCNCFGRFRRFPDSSNDRSLAAEFERQAMNYPIQSMIASAMSRAIAYLHDYKMRMLKKHNKNLFNIVLQIHDAILFEVPYKHVKHFCEYVLPKYMRDSVEIIPTNLDGMPTGTQGYKLGIEADVMDHWGEVVSHEKAEKHNLPTGTGTVTGCIVNYSTGKKVRPQRSSITKASKKRPRGDLTAPEFYKRKKTGKGGGIQNFAAYNKKRKKK